LCRTNRQKARQPLQPAYLLVLKFEHGGGLGEHPPTFHRRAHRLIQRSVEKPPSACGDVLAGASLRTLSAKPPDPGSDGIRNLRCEGGLSYTEWAGSAPSPEDLVNV
jgi:hypothetical protein